MAVDEGMLLQAMQGVASLRFYTWSEPTLSLGYFQASGSRIQEERLGSLPFVRRATGGGAIVHHHELTYSFALPSGTEWQPRHLNWVGEFHRVIASALNSLGTPISAGSCDTERGKGEFLCFLHHTPCDLLLQDGKVVGSAQRRRRGLMQHGSILLAQSDFTPQLPGILEQTGRAIEASELALAIRQSLSEDLGWGLQPDNWDDFEQDQISSLVREKYSSAAWNERR